MWLASIREPTFHRESLAAGDSYTAVWRWTNWCDGRENMLINARFYATGAADLLFGGGAPAWSLMAPTPACADLNANSLVSVWNGSSGGLPGPRSDPPAWCRAEDLQGRVVSAVQGEDVSVTLLVSSNRPCSLRADSAHVGIATGNGWVRDMSSDPATLDHDLDGRSEVAVVTSQWRNWCWRQGPESFAAGGLTAVDSDLTVVFTVPLGTAPLMPDALIGPAAQAVIGSDHTWECT